MTTINHSHSAPIRLLHQHHQGGLLSICCITLLLTPFSGQHHARSSHIHHHLQPVSIKHRSHIIAISHQHPCWRFIHKWQFKHHPIRSQAAPYIIIPAMHGIQSITSTHSIHSSHSGNSNSSCIIIRLHHFNQQFQATFLMQNT